MNHGLIRIPCFGLVSFSVDAMLMSSIYFAGDILKNMH